VVKKFPDKKQQLAIAGETDYLSAARAFINLFPAESQDFFRYNYLYGANNQPQYLAYRWLKAKRLSSTIASFKVNP
jgi:hypothetical protein